MWKIGPLHKTSVRPPWRTCGCSILFSEQRSSLGCLGQSNHILQASRTILQDTNVWVDRNADGAGMPLQVQDLKLTASILGGLQDLNRPWMELHGCWGNVPLGPLGLYLWLDKAPHISSHWPTLQVEKGKNKHSTHRTRKRRLFPSSTFIPCPPLTRLNIALPIREML